jgi:glycine/D-amino acid oxidase-like deaminating enzyme
MTVLRWIDSRCAVVTRLKPHSHQARSVPAAPGSRSRQIAVLGAGVVGVAAAHALAERGHEVHVYDRRSDIASDTSASTAGLVTPGHPYTWASPKAPAMLVKSLLGESTSIRVRPRADATWCAGAYGSSANAHRRGRAPTHWRNCDSPATASS